MYTTHNQTTKYSKKLLGILSVFALALTFSLLSPQKARAATTVVISSVGTNQDSFGYSGSLFSNMAQGFQVPSPSEITTFSVSLDKVGSPSDNVIVKIYDGVTQPTTLLATSNTLAGSTLTSSCTRYTITFSGTPTLTSSTQYWFVLDRDGGFDTSNRYHACSTNTNPYPNGNSASFNGSTWTQAPNDDINSEFEYDIPLTTGCTYSEAENYDSSATQDDGSCTFDVPTSAEAYYNQAIKDMYQTKLYQGTVLFLIMMFGFIFYFLIKYKK